MKPNNPYNIVIKNEFYPNGLRELEIYNYWIKNKSKILFQLRDHFCLLYIYDENNNIIKRRYIKDKQLIQLNDGNYEKIIHGRIVGIVKLFKEKSEYGVIDIDTEERKGICSPAEFEKCRKTAGELYLYFTKLYKLKLYYSGKNGFHIYCQMPKPMNINKIREILSNQLNDINKSADLSPNKLNGGVIIPYSLNQIGLPCTEVKDLKSFSRESLVI